MIFVTGPLFSGKQEFISGALGWSDADFSDKAIRDVQDLAGKAEDLDLLASELAKYEVVLATEIGCGVVPVDKEERRCREAAGRLSCLLAEKADTVVRVCCGIPKVLKGELPC